MRKWPLAVAVLIGVGALSACAEMNGTSMYDRIENDGLGNEAVGMGQSPADITVTSDGISIAPTHDVQVSVRCPAGYFFDSGRPVTAHGSYIHLDEIDHPSGYQQPTDPVVVPVLDNALRPSGVRVWLYNASIDPASYGTRTGSVSITCDPVNAD